MSKIADDIQELVIEDVTFEEARMNFNRVLQRLFKNMVDSDSTDGSITLKIDVSLENEYIPNYDPDIEGEGRRIQKPKFKHKVSSNITVKDELTGNKNPEMQLVWDEGRQMYVLAYITGTDQRTIFDKDQPWNQEEGEGGQGSLETDPEKAWMNTPLLPGEVADEGALPGEVADAGALPGEVIDGECREVDEEEEHREDDGYSYEEPEDEE